MDTIQELEAKRDALLAQMRSIRSMRRGTINEQYLPVLSKGQKQPVRRGPYYVFSRRKIGQKQTLSWCLRTPEELEQAVARTLGKGSQTAGERLHPAGSGSKKTFKEGQDAGK